MIKKPIILGIESSCDETAASIVTENEQGMPTILSSIVSSQVDVHKEFGGVVPELAARSHIEKIDLITKVSSKTEYPKIIDTQFQQLGNLSVNQEIEETVTVNEFFELYNVLFYNFQSYWGSNSHDYLVKPSGDYINFYKDN